ncbi:MAG: threonine/serine exporter family protein [Hamadaea sp.]|uniref:threonine/serine ThrE exporter family protein n=1 Tax=Hamadaea sp. TaxID=2024425 RepID=UPI001821C8D8|nr:threonine/serine exporter family protein [Hamadaea sp.]NUT18070.1 threonine/serine exporter family protein [Hamadaea sp.]
MTADADAVLALTTRLARALVAGSFEGTLLAERRLRAVAAAYGQQAEVAVLPESATVALDGRTHVVTAIPAIPLLNRASAVKQWFADVTSGRSTIDQADRQLAAIQQLPPPYGRMLKVLGVVLFSVGFGVSIQATWQQVVFTAVAGTLIGLLVVATDAWPRLRWIAPLIASTVVAIAALAATQHGWISGGPIPLLLPALFVYIPGDSITMAMLELSSGRATAGAARFAQSLAALAVLAFGPVAALVLLDLPSSSLTDVSPAATLGRVAGWLGWIVFTVGVLLVFGMRARDLPWALAVVLSTYAVQLLAVRAVGDVAGTWFAAAAMTVLCWLLDRWPGSPPPYVMFLGAFFVLTPGSHGLRGLDSWIGGHPIQAVQSLTDMLGLLAAIALGILTAATIVPAPRTLISR